MLDLHTGTASDCSGQSRRSFLRVGGLAAFGLTLPTYLKAMAEQPAVRQTKAKRCILLWMQGGPSHHDSFDPKPDAPADVRGEFGTVPTTLPGVRFADPLPMLARQTDKLAVIRGHDPKNGSHGVADALMMSGRPFNASLPFPCYGSVVAKERGYVDGMIPFVQLGKAIDRRFNGGIAGFIGDEFNPFEVHEDPSAAVFRVRDLSVGTDSERTRLDRRYAMLSELEAYQRAAETNPAVVKARDEFYEKAHGIITSPAAKKAFDVAAEPDRVRERYGKTMFGQQCLLARRLVESGVQFVTVTDGGWDTHTDNFKSLKNRLLRASTAGSRLCSTTFPPGGCSRRRSWSGSGLRPHAEDQLERRPRSLVHGGLCPDGRRRPESRPGYRPHQCPRGICHRHARDPRGHRRDHLPRDGRELAHLVQGPGRPAHRTLPGRQARPRNGGVSRMSLSRLSPHVH